LDNLRIPAKEIQWNKVSKMIFIIVIINKI
jgi:hypothetical protein